MKKVVDYFAERGISEGVFLENNTDVHQISEPKVSATGIVSIRDMGAVTREAIVYKYKAGDKLIDVKYDDLDGNIIFRDGIKPTFFNIDKFNKDGVIICKSELDVLSVAQSGVLGGISIPNPIEKNMDMSFFDNCADVFEANKETVVFLAVGNDEKSISLREELARRVGKDRCRLVKFPEGCNSINDVLLGYGEELVQQILIEAEFYPLEGVVDFDDVYSGTMDLYNNGIDKGVEVGLKDQYGQRGFDELLTFKTSLLYLVTGIPSHGKSSFLNYIEVLLATKHGWKFGIFSPEHYPLQYLVYRYAELIIGKRFFKGKTGENRMTQLELERALDFIKNHFFFIRPKDGSAKMAELIDIAKQLVMRHGIKGFTIDPWNTIDHDYGSQGSETLYVEKSLNLLTGLKQDADLAVFIVAHPRKMQKIRDKNSKQDGQYEVPTLYDISGSKSFYDKADVGVTVYRNFENNVTSVYVQKVKFKHIGETGMVDYKYSLENSRYYPCDVDGVSFTPFEDNLISKEGVQTEVKPEWQDDERFSWMDMKSHRDDEPETMFGEV